MHYEYFYCLGRQRLRNGCTFRAVQVDLVERAIDDHWATVQRSEAEISRIRALVLDHIAVLVPHLNTEQGQAKQTLLDVAIKSQKLLEVHYADAISIEHLKREQDRLAIERTEAEQIIR